MKTLEDLIDKLNETKEDEGIYYLSEDHKGMFTVDYRIDNQVCRIAIFDTLNKVILLTTNTNIMNWQEMYWISKYALEHPYKDWFPEKKYNIIIGENPKWKTYTLYRHDGEGGFESGDFLGRNSLDNKYFQFTESQIEKLKSKLPENLAKIVDLGKVEVKDD